MNFEFNQPIIYYKCSNSECLGFNSFIRIPTNPHIQPKCIKCEQYCVKIEQSID